MKRKSKKKNRYADLEGLNFPIFDKPMPDPDPLSMDDYLQFVLANLEWFPDSRPLKAQNYQRPVSVMFSLK